MALAAVFAAIVGIERQEKNKPIDFRAYVIIAISSCGLCLLAQELGFRDRQIDLGKVIAGVLTGIGFLGAGAIIHVKDKTVIGTATGASVWASGGMGITLGFGYYGLATLLFIAMFLTLYVGGLATRFFPNQ